MAGKSRKSTGATRPKSGSGTAKNRTGNMKHKSTTLAFGEATFDDAKRKEWVTGYHKRKTQRRKKAAKDIEDRARRERIAARKERRDAEKIALGLIDGPGDGDGDGDGDGGGDGGGADDGGGEKEKETTYGSGVTVTVMEGF
jgi:ribosomal RNA-processing protein 17